MKYSIVTNNYEDSLKIESDLFNLLQSNKNNKRDNKNPNYVFVIGGDGTFLEAIAKFSNILDDVIFVPMKFGGIGFYTNKNFVSNLKEIVEQFSSAKPNTIDYSLLEIRHDGNVSYSVNEIKIMNNTKPVKLSIQINENHLEDFRGTGLVFATPSGSTGFMKSAGGAIIYPNLDLYQMQELFPVSTNKFRTLNAPIIFDNNQIIKLNFENSKDIFLSVDTRDVPFKENELSIGLSEKRARVLFTNDEALSKTKILNDIFVLNNSTKN